MATTIVNSSSSKGAGQHGLQRERKKREVDICGFYLAQNDSLLLAEFLSAKSKVSQW